jgi:hypothetical protein
MDRWLRFTVVLVVLLGVFAVGSWLLLKELERVGGRSDPGVFVNPVADIRVGDWVEHQREDKIERQEVIQASVAGYVLKITYILPSGQELDAGTRPQRVGSLGLGDNHAIVSMRREKIDVAGRTWNAWRVEGRFTGGALGEVTSWISEELPLGLLRRDVAHRPHVQGNPWNHEYLRGGSKEEGPPR